MCRVRARATGRLPRRLAPHACAARDPEGVARAQRRVDAADAARPDGHAQHDELASRRARVTRGADRAGVVVAAGAVGGQQRDGDAAAGGVRRGD